MTSATTTTTTTTTNHSLIGNALQLLAVGLGPYVTEKLRESAGMGRYVPDDVDVIGDIEADVSVMLRVMATGWNEVFREHLGQLERSLVSEIRETRNRWAHLEQFNEDDLDRALDSIGRLLKAVGSNNEAARVDRAKHRLRTRRYAPETPAADSPAETPGRTQPTPEFHDPQGADVPAPTYVEPATTEIAGMDYGDKIADLIRRGAECRQVGDFPRAIAHFGEAIGINRDDAEAWYERGLTWGHMGEFKRAINDFNRALSLREEYGDAFNGRGYARYCLGDFLRAVDDFEDAVRLDPDDELARVNLEMAQKKSRLTTRQ